MKTKLKQISSLFLSLTSCVLILNSCDTNDPPPGNGNKETITISVEDTSPTEVWLKLTGKTDGEFIVERNNEEVKRITLTGTDNIIYDDSLQPSTTYTYQVSSIKNQVSSNGVTFTTMDTTSHNFTWQTYSFGGQGGSSALYDVAIINENDIWAVGEIYTADDKYNAVHWNGSRWELKKFTTTGYISPIYTVFAFNENDIWFNGLVQWDGNTLSVHIENFPLEPNGDGWRINSIWGTSSIDFYVVGNGGNIARFNGSSWQKIESGTTTHINDAWGLVTNQNQTILYCPVSSFFVPGEKKILKIIDNSVETVKWNEDARLYSAWAKNENILYACGEGVFENKFGEWKEIELYAIGTNSIRGNDLNDIFIAGDYGAIFHFNGSSWQLLNSLNSSKGYSKVSTLENLVVVCGNQNGQGLIEIGTRK